MNISAHRSYRFFLTLLLASLGVWLGGLIGHTICLLALSSRILAEGLTPRFAHEPAWGSERPRVYVIDSRALMMGAS